MKKNIFKYVVLVFLLMSMPASAQSLKVTALTPFNSAQPATTMKVMVLEKAEFKNGMVLENGAVVLGNILEVKQPKRAKLNASFKFKPVSYTYNGKTVQIDREDFIAKYVEYKEIDKGELVTSAATTVGGFFVKVPGLSQGVSMIKGVIKNPESNRLKSGVVQVYKDSPLSYVEEGKDIVINKDQMFVLKFKSSKPEEEVPSNNAVPAEAAAETTVVPAKDFVPAPLPVNTNVNVIKVVNPEAVLKEVESSKTDVIYLNTK